MSWLPIIMFIMGFILGSVIIAIVLKWAQAKTAKESKDALDAVIENMKASFGSLSLDALNKSTEGSIKLSKEILGKERELNVKELNEKKELIDQQLKQMGIKLDNISQVGGGLTKQLEIFSKQTATLTETTGTLREALASTKTRGQWGERMAEDVLRIAGFIENVNYVKQKAVEEGRSIPDFTFSLPNGKKVNMDVKFPLDNYLKFLETNAETDKAKFRNNFLRDVKARVKEVTSREYINPEKNTIDFAILFIPNEQVYTFIYEQDSSIMDEGIKNKVIICSPITLFAILAIIRQSLEIFALEQHSKEILSLVNAFRKQWSAFSEKLELVGKRITDAQKEYDALTTTRLRQLKRPLSKIEEIEKQHGLPLESTDEDIEALPSINEEETKEEDI